MAVIAGVCWAVSSGVFCKVLPTAALSVVSKTDAADVTAARLAATRCLPDAMLGSLSIVIRTASAKLPEKVCAWQVTDTALQTNAHSAAMVASRARDEPFDALSVIASRVFKSYFFQLPEDFSV